MSPLLFDPWLALLCLLLAAALLLTAAVQRRRHGTWNWLLWLPGTMVLAYGLGALQLFSAWLGMVLALTASAIFVLLLVLVILSGLWSAPLGFALAAFFFLGLGAATGQPVAAGLQAAALFLAYLRPLEPYWLLLLLFVPALFWTSGRHLISLGPVRRWLALSLRCGLIVFLVCALAEMHTRKAADSVTVLFVWDRSLSMPPEVKDGEDMREKRLLAFMNEAVALRGSRHANDRAGVLVFGKHPKLELAPGLVPKLGFTKVMSDVDRTYTDIAAALKLALASFPENAGKRIVLISDGNENRGNAEEQARIARENGVEIDVVPIAAHRQQENEILVERIEAPASTEAGRPLPLRVVIRSYHPQVVVARLNLRKTIFDATGVQPQVIGKETQSMIVKLRQGLNVYDFPQPGIQGQRVHLYEATIVPLQVETPQGALVHKDLPGDRIENNEARVAVFARGERALLILEPEAGSHETLVERLRAYERGLRHPEKKDDKPALKIVAMTPERMRQITQGDTEKLAIFLSTFDAVIFANVPADKIPPEEQKVFRSNVHDQGAGFIMIGGNQSFGAGGWQNTEIAKALPVNIEPKSMKVMGRTGLVLMMHASEMAEGNSWQRKIAKLAVDKLAPVDMVGLILWGIQGNQWHIPFIEIGANRPRIMKLLDTMDPGDMQDVNPAFGMALKELADPRHQLGTRHIIFISDGDHWDASAVMLKKLIAAKITCTTVCITTHGQAEVKKLKFIAEVTGGRPYHITNPRELPQIYAKETRLISKSFVHEGKFDPQVLRRQGPTLRMPDPPPPLHGFVRTSAKEGQLVQMLLETPLIGEAKFPLLASWQYGLGKSVAFTSDARSLADGDKFWDRDWLNSKMYAPFWWQTIASVLRPVEKTDKHLRMTTEHKDGKIRVIVEAQDNDKAPLTEAELQAGISSPTFKIKGQRKLVQKNAGVYEAEFPADEVGAYFIYVQARWKKAVKATKDGKEVTELQDVRDSIRAGVTIPYSPEFAEMESNPALLEKLAHMTAGKVYADDAAVLQAVARRGDVFRPVPRSHAALQPLWPWLVFLAALCLLLDVAVRRIAIQPEAVWAKGVALWQRLRGQRQAEEALPVFIERLKSRKAQVDEAIEKQKAARKFEAPEGAPVKPVESAGAAPPAAPEKPKTPPAPQEPEEDFATRLMRAKKKALEERDKK